MYIVVSLALMELTGLISKQYLAPLYDHICSALKYKTLEIPIESESQVVKMEKDKVYMAKVITFAVIFILMHTFYILFEKTEISIALALLIFASLIGSAAILLAVGTWAINIQSKN